jgi:hypothetical protein
VAIISIAATAHADEPEKTLPVNISVDIHWDIDEGSSIRKGHFRINAKSTLNLDRPGSGLDHKPKLTPLTLKYRGRSFTGSCHFEETLTQKDPQPPRCPPLLESYSGSRGFSYSPPEEYDSINLFLRRFGIAKSLIKSGVSGVGAQQFLAQLQSQVGIPPSYYDFAAGGVSGRHTIPGKKRKMENGECRYEKVETQVFMSVIGLRFPIPEDGPMEGKQTWSVKLDGPPRNFSIKLSQTGVGKEKPFRPESVASGGNATYSISWSFKEVSPELRILVKKEEGWKDVTGESTEEVCVGQKVFLKYEVYPEGADSVSSAKWQIPGMPDLLINDWQGDEASSQKTPFKKGDCHNQTLKFAWVDGSFQGQEQKITCTARVKEKTLTADTTFKVYKPKVDVKIKAGKEIKVGVPPDVGSTDCEMYPDSPSIKLKSEVTMPDPFKNQVLSLFYIQLVECDAWGLQRIGFPHYEWFNNVHKQMLDTSFPYKPEKKGVSPLVVTMDDTPGFPLSSMASAYAHMKFQTYLMFKPPEPKSGGGITSVPLKRVDWEWKGATVATGKPYPKEKPPCGKGHKIVCNKAPAAHPPEALDCNQYPKWKGTKAGSKPKPTRKMTEDREELPPTDIKWGIKK